MLDIDRIFQEDRTNLTKNYLASLWTAEREIKSVPADSHHKKAT